MKPNPRHPLPARPDWEERLRAGGYRSTRARRLVLAALDRLGHGTVEELSAAVAADDPEINLSTIYRTLEALGEVGLVTHAHLTQGSPTYHSALAAAHIHLVCRGCGQITEAPAEVAGTLVETLRGDFGFSADVAHLAVHGRCAQCRDATAADPANNRD